MNESSTMVHQEGFAVRCQKVLHVARELYSSKPDWVTFFRETLGVKGAARSVFTTQAEYVAFEKSAEFAEIQQMVAALRSRKIPGNGSNEPTLVITVRLPESLHEALKAEASDHNTSMNKLCISKLLQVLVDNDKSAIPQMGVPRTANNLASPKPPVPGTVPFKHPAGSQTVGTGAEPERQFSIYLQPEQSTSIRVGAEGRQLARFGALRDSHYRARLNSRSQSDVGGGCHGGGRRNFRLPSRS